MRTLLVIDDEPNIVYSFKSTLTSPQLSVISAGTAREGIELVKSARPDVVMLDVRLPDLSGLQAYERIRAADERIPVIIMTAFAKTETAIEAMRLGAFEYLVKPVDLRRLRDVVSKALEVSRLNRVPALLESGENDDIAADHIVGNSAAMQDVYKGIGRIAPQERTGRPGDLSLQPEKPEAVSRHQLCRSSGVASGERIIRPRTRRVYGGRPAQDWEV